MPALEVTGLVYAYKQNRAVDGIDLTVEPGSVHGLLGPNGAGKTTAIRAITTLLPIPAGMVKVFGRDPARDQMGVRRSLGYVPQQLSADAGLTGLQAAGTPGELIASLPQDYRHGASLEAAFRYYSGGAGLDEAEGGTFRNVRSTRTTAHRVR